MKTNCCFDCRAVNKKELPDAVEGCLNPICPCHTQTEGENINCTCKETGGASCSVHPSQKPAWEETNKAIARVILSSHSMTREITEFGSRSTSFDEKMKLAGDAIDELKVAITRLIREAEEKQQTKLRDYVRVLGFGINIIDLTDPEKVKEAILQAGKEEERREIIKAAELLTGFAGVRFQEWLRSRK